ncbi:MAG: hypothetical protein ACK4GB_02335 [Tepidimonas sp.]
MAPSSVGGTSFRLPPKVPMAVRTALTTTTSRVMTGSPMDQNRGRYATRHHSRPTVAPPDIRGKSADHAWRQKPPKHRPARRGDARQRLFGFVCGWVGGPPLCVQKHGHPCLRRRHPPSANDPHKRDQWMLLCMGLALAEEVSNENLRQAGDRLHRCHPPNGGWPRVASSLNIAILSIHPVASCTVSRRCLSRRHPSRAACGGRGRCPPRRCWRWPPTGSGRWTRSFASCGCRGSTASR